MNPFRKLLRRCVLVACAFMAAGCQRAAQPVSADVPTVERDGTTYRISGPYAHDNLSVFLLHSGQQDEREFITLDEGLKKDLVKVSEKANAQVRELQIENRSDYPLFLQEGDRLQGGKQDRALIASLVIPAKSGTMPVPTFCIEQGRWTEGERGQVFHGTVNFALAGKEVRQAAKVEKSQEKVWKSVKEQKEAATGRKLAKSTNSSLNETFDSPEVKKLSDEMAQALGGVLQAHPDAVGAAIVVNGHIEEVNIYPNHKLLGKLYVRLLQSYALQAALEKDRAKDAKACSASDLIQFMAKGKEKSTRNEKIDGKNSLCIQECDGKDMCRTEYQGTVVHQQILSKKK